MKASPFLEQIMHVVALFLKKNGHKTQAKSVEKLYSLPDWVKQDNPLFEKGLVKIIKSYVKNNNKVQQYFENREPESEDEESENEEVIKKQSKRKKQKQNIQNKEKKQLNSPNTRLRSASPKVNVNSSWMSKFSEPKKLEDINNLQTKMQKVEKKQDKKMKDKSNKKSLREEIQSSDYESEEDSFELQPQKKLKKDKKVEKIQEKKKEKIIIEEKRRQNTPAIVPENQRKVYTKKNGFNQSFSRINKEEVGPIKAELKDNSFQAKAKYGEAADEWGNFGFDKLKDARGDSFKKTKGKLKNKAFQGNLMDINKINSIPIL